MRSADVLRFDNLDFRYRRSGPPIFHAFTWEVPSGRTVLLGPNGAGKTTLLSLGADALQPNRGRVVLGSLDPRRRADRAAFRKSVGWMPQQVRTVPGLTAREQVAYAGWLKGQPRAEAWSNALRALDRVALADHAERLTSQLSGGQLRRVGLAQALVHEAPILLLDEPTAGLDPSQRARFRETLASLSRSLAVVVSTHQVDDLSDLFDTVVVIDLGHMRYQGSVSSFLELAPREAQRPGEAAYASVVAHDG